MSSELRMAQLLDQFVDDLNEGRTPQVYELMASGDEDVAELLPLLDLAAFFKAATAQMSTEEKARGKAQIMDMTQANHAAETWSMRRLVAESDPRLVARGATLGLAPTELDAVSSDMTPFDLENPNEVVAELARKYRVQFYGLMRWVRQLISDVLRSQPSSSMTMLYARDGSRNEDDHSE